MIARTARPWRWCPAAVVFITAAALSSPAAAQPLAVPYLPQTEELCGGAAAAMVMRYWGATDAFPDAFAPLVDRSAGGIRTGALVSDLRRRGWDASDREGDAPAIAGELAHGRPVIALIQDSPRRYHYVVVVGWSDGKVTLHDPARAPNRVIDAARFDAQWQKSGRWMLVLVPGVQPHAIAEAAGPADGDEVAPAGPCAPLVRAAVQLAGSDRSAARAALERATAQCPDEGAPWRELAGLDVLDQDWTKASAHAQRAVTIDPRDRYAWRTLATARYVAHDDLSALAAWNRLGEPAVSLIDIKGLAHTRYGVIADAVGVELRAVLTPDAVRRAERRVRDVPAVAASRLSFRPAEDGRARIDVSIVERDRVPAPVPAAIRAGFDAVTARQVSASFSNLTGGGETAGAAWRWWRHRPMIAAFYAAPAPAALGGGVWRLDVAHETQTFGTSASVETRTSAGISLGNWLSGATRFSAGLALDRWNARAEDVAVTAGLEHWRAANRLRLTAEMTQSAGRDSFATARVTAAARSSAAPTGWLVFGLAGYSAASRTAPASVWPGADTGQARDVLLRAHPLLEDGIVTGGAFGRRLAFGTVELQRWSSLRRLPLRFASAVFVDAARARRGLDAVRLQPQIDAGAGLRIAVPGFGAMRLDLAKGLRDGGFVFSAGWDRRW